MGLIGTIFSLPVRVLNTPAVIIDETAKALGIDDRDILSTPLNDIADELETLDD